MQNSEKILRELLSTADIEINGKYPWDLQVHDDRFFDRVLKRWLTRSRRVLYGWVVGLRGD